MGKSAPKPPPAPDPTQIINAETNANQQSATTQAKLNNVNYSGPQGTVTYNLEPNTGQFTENVLLNPTEQAAESAYQQDQRLGADIAGEQLGAVRGALGQHLNPPSLQTSAPVGNLATGYDSGGSIQYGYDSGGPIQKSINNTPVQTGIANPGAIQGQVAPTYSPFSSLQGGQGPTPYAGQTAYAASPAPQGSSAPPSQGSSQGSPAAGQPAQSNQALLQQTRQLFGDGTNAARIGAFEQWLGSGSQLPAAQQKVYDQLKQQHPDYNDAQLQFLSFQPHLSADAQAQVQKLGAGQSQGAPPSSQSAPPQQQGAPAQSQGAYQNDPWAAAAANPVLGTQLATYAQARQMLDPQWQQATEQQQAQLAAQGLNPNSAAYQNAMRIFGQQQNDAYNSAAFGAINAGDTEQNALYGQNLASAQYALGAQNQNYSQLMGEAGLYNSANGQLFNQNLQQGQLANSAQLQGNQENAAAAAFHNGAQNQANAQNAAAAAFQNQAYGQNFQEQYANAQLANSAAQQNFQNQAYAQQLPINEFSALMGSSQVAMPPSAPAQNTPVAPPNTLGAYTLQQNALQNAYEAQMQNSQSGLGGLFNLGASALKTFIK